MKSFSQQNRTGKNWFFFLHGFSVATCFRRWHFCLLYRGFFSSSDPVETRLCQVSICQGENFNFSLLHTHTHTHTHTSDCHTHTQEELITINWSVSTKPWAKFYRHGFWKKIFEWILKQLWYISFWSFVFSTRQLTRLHWRFLPTSKLCLETLGIPSPARSCTDVTALLSGLMFRALLLLQSVQK